MRPELPAGTFDAVAASSANAIRHAPTASRQTTEALTRALLDKMMVDGEMCIRVLAEAHGDRNAAHALNVAVISLLMGRVFGFSDADMMDLGVGALMHDVGKCEIPDRLRSYGRNELPAKSLPMSNGSNSVDRQRVQPAAAGK